MTLSDKIVGLRKSNGMSQEALAKKLNVSRQAISRWEMGTAMPDAGNILQLSKLFGVTTDYLLNEDYESDEDLPKVREIKEDGAKQILVYLILLEIMAFLVQFMMTFILQNAFLAGLSFIPFLAIIGGFEYGYRKNVNGANERTLFFRKRFYKISAWLGLYFPIRFLAMMMVQLYPRSILRLVFECMVLAVYMAVAMCVNLLIDKHYLLGGK